MIDDKFIEYIPISDLDKPRGSGLFQIYVDYYWFVTDDNKVLKYTKFSKSGTYQCNQNLLVMEKMQSHYPDCKIVKLPLMITEARG